MNLDKQLRQGIVWRGFYYLSALGLNIVLSRILLANTFGSLFYFVNVLSLIVLVAGLSLESAFTYFVASKKITDSEVVLISFVWLLIIIVPVCIILNYFFTDRNIYGIMFIVGNLLTTYFTALFNAHHRYNIPNLIIAIVNILAIALITINRASERITAVIFFYTFLVQGILSVVAFIMLYKINVFKASLQWKNTQKIFNYAGTALMANLIFFLLYRIDYWFVEKWCSGKEMGNYIQASKMGQLLLAIPQMLAVVVFPTTASGEKPDDLQKVLFIIARLLLQAFVVLFFIFYLAGKNIFVLIFGSDFSGMNIPFLFLLPGIFCLAFLSLLSAYFGGSNKVSVNLKGAFWGLLIVVTGSFLLQQWYSIKVAAIISSAGYIVNFLYAFFIFNKSSGIKFSALFAFKQDDWIWLRKMIINK
jgi:O-antigen/teichoic acid export membrane protein